LKWTVVKRQVVGGLGPRGRVDQPGPGGVGSGLKKRLGERAWWRGGISSLGGTLAGRGGAVPRYPAAEGKPGGRGGHGSCPNGGRPARRETPRYGLAGKKTSAFGPTLGRGIAMGGASSGGGERTTKKKPRGPGGEPPGHLGTKKGPLGAKRRGLNPKGPARGAFGYVTRDAPKGPGARGGGGRPRITKRGLNRSRRRQRGVEGGKGGGGTFGGSELGAESLVDVNSYRRDPAGWEEPPRVTAGRKLRARGSWLLAQHKRSKLGGRRSGGFGP